MSESRFCPVLSDANNNVPCYSNCMWHAKDENECDICAVVGLNLAIGALIEVVESDKKR